jgi:hypothetical protein
LATFDHNSFRVWVVALCVCLSASFEVHGIRLASTRRRRVSVVHTAKTSFGCRNRAQECRFLVKRCRLRCAERFLLRLRGSLPRLDRRWRAGAPRLSRLRAPPITGERSGHLP